MKILYPHIFSKFPEVESFITTKPHFFHSSIHKSEDTYAAEKNKIYLAQKLWISQDSLVFLSQKHGNTTHLITSENYSQEHYGDAAITNIPWVFMSVLASDCIPLLIYDAKNTCVWAIHAGWRWLFSGIISKTFQKMHESFSSEPQDLYVFVGPCIWVQNYEVGEDFISRIPEEYTSFLEQRNKNYFFHLRATAEHQLLKYGVLHKHIEVSPYCTYKEKELFHSYRRKMHFPEEVYGNNAFGIRIKLKSSEFSKM